MDITKYIGETTEYDKKQEVEVKVREWARLSIRLKPFPTLRKRCFHPSSPIVPSLLSRSPI